MKKIKDKATEAGMNSAHTHVLYIKTVYAESVLCPGPTEISAPDSLTHPQLGSGGYQQVIKV
jgi:hypothetical protein